MPYALLIQKKCSPALGRSNFLTEQPSKAQLQYNQLWKHGMRGKNKCLSVHCTAQEKVLTRLKGTVMYVRRALGAE